MHSSKVISFPELKVADHEFEVEFDVELVSFVNEDAGQFKDFKEQVISDELKEINEALTYNEKRLKELNNEIDNLTNSSDGIDYMVAVGSGILTGILDSLWVGEFDFERGKKWSYTTVNKFVIKAAQVHGYEDDRLRGAIEFLENNFKVPSDNIWKNKNVNISARSHHLDDLAHHPTPIGLFISILTQFTKKGYFQNSNGEFIPIIIDILRSIN